EEALAASNRLGNDRHSARHSFNIGQALAGLGDHDRALEYFDRALAWLRAMGPNRFVMVPLLGMADIYLDRGRADDALALAEEALATARRVGHEGYVSEAKIMRWRALAANGSTNEAIEALEELAANGRGHEAK